MLDWLFGWLKKKPTKNFNLPEVKGEHWDQQDDPDLVSYTKFRARRLLQEKDKQVDQVEEQRKEDQATGHNPWLD